MKHLGLAIAVLTAGTAYAQDTVSPPLNEFGEEIYGEGYLPKSTANPGEYFIAVPNAGLRAPDALLMLPQSTIRLPLDPLSLPPERQNLPQINPFGVPLRKEFAGPFNTEAPSPATVTPMSNPAPILPPGDGVMHAHFVDVGQGAAAILEFSCGIAVIDVGGEWGNEAVDGAALFIDYLNAFFETRTYLKNTIDVVFLSHPHADHLNGVEILLPEGGGPFRILNVVDNGQEGTTGGLKKQTEFKTRAVALDAGYTGVEVTPQQRTATGVTSAAIDPLACDGVDPILTAFWGGRTELAGQGEYANINNHSVVVRVDFGQASFLFVGDLEDRGVVDMLDEYSTNPGVFDADVYLVSHHGADQVTTDNMLGQVMPQIAVISMGAPTSPSTKKYGHPRVTTLVALEEDDPEQPGADFVSDDHPGGPVTVAASPAANSEFEDIEVSKAIYATGWDGSIVIEATSGGSYTIGTSAPD